VWVRLNLENLEEYSGMELDCVVKKRNSSVFDFLTSL
jgi:hypothetical protein